MKAKVKGRALAILISLAMVFTMMPMMGVAAYAKQNTKKTESVKTLNGKGDGTESNPYQISTYAELKEFAEIVNGTHDKISQNTGAWAILTDDIECTDMKWVPIATEAKPYTGTFDGNNKKIEDLSNEETEGAASAMFQGLFGVTGSKATVKNVGLVNVFIHGNMYIGGVAGWNNGTITDCYSSGNVSGNDGTVGGVAGYNSNVGTITNCNNTGDVSGSGFFVGGVAGYNDGGIITSCYNTGDVSGNNSVGGVVGLNGGTITNCYNTGDVSGEGNVGGVAGRNGGTITNCCNTGKVSGTGHYVGGVAGSNGGTITNCYNTGDVSGDSYVGGVAGWNEGTITNCYYDSDKSGVSSAIGDSDDTDTVNGLNTENMAGEDALNNMQFKYAEDETSPWMVKKTDDYAMYYPHLKGFNLDKEGNQMNAEDISPYDWPARIDKIVAPPTFSPELRLFYPDQRITISCATKGATIYYTTDGTEPTTSGNKYTEPIVITKTTTIKAIAVKEGIDDSEIASATYTKIKGDGSPKKPVLISNYDELKEFADIVNGTHKTIQQNTGACAKLTNDIECNDETWVPIGNSSNEYTGTFDGKNKKIEDLSNEETGGAEFQGLFGKVGSGATVKDVGLVNVYIHGNRYIGGVAGWNKGTITNCYNTGDVSGASSVGGVAGRNAGTITNCYNTGKVSGSGFFVGGVAGFNDETITNCYNTGDVSGERHVGGVAGQNYSETIENCYNTGDVSGERNVGGVAGSNGFNGTITNCYNTGDVSGSGNSVGGVAGENYGTITNCYYDSDTSDVSSAIGGSDDTDTVKGLATEEMTGTSCTAYDSWGDFYAVWRLTDDYPVLDPHEHQLTYEKEQSCVEPGHAEGYTCSVCSKHYSDQDGKNLIPDADWIIPVTGHKYGTWTKLDANQHQRECKNDKTHVEKANHTWDAGKVTKSATTTATGIKTYTCSVCKATRTETIAKLPEQKDPEDPKKDDPEKQYGTDGTPVGPGASIEAAEKAITNTTSDKDIKGTTFAPLKFKSSSQGKMNIKLSWAKNKKAVKYVVYGNLCNAGSKKYKPVKLATVKSGAYNVKKIKTAKVKKGTYYKFVMVALDKDNKVVSTTKTIHVTTKGGKTGNYKSVTIKAKVNAKGKAIKKAKPLSKTVLKKGKSLKLIVKMNPSTKKQKVKKHVGLRYETTNAKVATVSGNKIKAKGKGKCIVYAYTQNGVAKAIKITVK